MVYSTSVVTILLDSELKMEPIDFKLNFFFVCISLKSPKETLQYQHMFLVAEFTLITLLKLNILLPTFLTFTIFVFLYNDNFRLIGWYVGIIS